MSYLFCFGPSGSGKSRYLRQLVIQKAQASLAGQDRTRYIFLVPEQYTMQTQRELVLDHPAHVLMNIDVLSFGRLAYRVFAETGVDRRTVLDDIGKSLLLRRAASRCAQELQILKRGIRSPGMIDEVKSVLSEFMQYGVEPEEIDGMADYAAEHGHYALQARLRDLQTLYKEFENEKKDRFMTGEETLSLLESAIPESASLRNSVIVFDGFTGFTALQYRVVMALLRCAKEVVFSLTVSNDQGPAVERTAEGGPAGGEEDLFYLTRKTVFDIVQMAKKENLNKTRDLYLPSSPVDLNTQLLPRYGKNRVLAHLEHSLFRYPEEPFRETFSGETSQGLRLFSASTPQEEVRQILGGIQEMITRTGCAYRDFAIVTADLETYGDLFAIEAARYRIPVYIDRTDKGFHNILFEGVRAVLQISAENFSYSAVFRYLRSGLSRLTGAEVDHLENYCLANGIRGRGKWAAAFDASCEEARVKFLREILPVMGLAAEEERRTSALDGNAEKGYPETAVPERNAENDPAETSAPDGNAENDIENTVSSSEKKGADPGKRRTARTAAERTVELYEYLLGVGAQARMDELSRQFGRDGDPVREKQYAQIYRALVDLLDQIYELAGDERVSARSYLELLEAGFSQIRLGTIPQQADRVLVGDMERTRLTQVRHLFFAGANDGSIPRGASRGGILSDMDREFLARGGASLSPTPRQQMFTQRLYLYLNMTKPSETLTVSFSKTSMDGRSLRPSYLVSLLQCIFPDLQLEFPETRPLREQINGSDTGYSLLAGMLRRFVEGNPEVQTSAGEREFRLVYGFFTSAEVMADPERRRAVSMLRRAALYRYRPETLQTEIARRLYGNMLSGGISRLETGAQCMLRQHLRYGLRLMERDIFAFAAVDAGTVLHAALQQFDAFLRRESNSWRTFTAEDAVRLTEKALYTVAARYRNLLFYNSSRDESRLLRLEKCLLRTVDTLQYQIRKGDLDPAASELSFGMEQTDSPEMAHAAAMPDVVVKPDAVAVPDVTGRPDYADPVSGAFFSGIDFSGTSSLPETAPQIPAPPETASMDVQEEMSLNAHNREAGSGRGMLPQQLPAIRFDLGNGRRLFLVGRIDRVDLYVQDGRCFVRILDYKTGSRDLDENQIRRGLQLQLITYMEALRNAFSGGLYMTFVRDEKGEKDSRDPYMPSGGNESAEHERAEKLPEMIPAAMLYYKMEDPVLSEEEASVLSFPDSGTPGRKETVLSDVPASFALSGKQSSGKQISGEHSSGEQISGEQISGEQISENQTSGEQISEKQTESIRKKLRPTGLVYGDAEAIAHLDRQLSSNSDVIPVGCKKTGGYTAASRIIEPAAYRVLAEEAAEAIRNIANGILDGVVTASPALLDNGRSGCDYCPYRDACGFDPRIPGYEKRRI